MAYLRRLELIGLLRQRLWCPQSGALPQQVMTTAAAVALMEKLRAKHGPLMFHQSGGCCDGSSPMCYPLGEFMTGDSDVLLADGWRAHRST